MRVEKVVNTCIEKTSVKQYTNDNNNYDTLKRTIMKGFAHVSMHSK